jgi:hypothetical protein
VKMKDKMMTGEVVMMKKLACMGAREGNYKSKYFIQGLPPFNLLSKAPAASIYVIPHLLCR